MDYEKEKTMCTMRVLTDSVCVRVLFSETLLVANGNQLLLFYLSPNGDTCRIVAPVPQLMYKIQGIDACVVGDREYLVIFHAGREAYCTVLDCKSYTFTECRLITVAEQKSHEPTHRKRLNGFDWISSIKLLSSTELCIVTCKAIAVTLKCSENDMLQWNFVEKSICKDRSTLYCSTIVGQQGNNNVLCFSGTALGLLSIWSVGGNSQYRGKVLKCVSGHNGVIFSIACDLPSGLLTTTSDDRSIKFWNFNLEMNEGTDISSVNIREERYCFAHTARVFRCRIIKSAARTVVATIGEDSHLCLWSTEGDLLLKKRLDEGPTLWNMDYDPDKATIFITASNGNLHKYCIEHILSDDADRSEEHTDMVDVTPLELNNEHLAKVKYLSNGNLVTVTNNNRLLVLDNKDTKPPISLGAVEQCAISIMEAGGRHIFLAGGRNVLVYDATTLPSAALVTSKTISFVHEAFSSEEDEECSQLGTIRSLNYCARSGHVAVCNSKGRCIIFDNTFSAVVSYHRILSPAEPWLTFFVELNAELMLMADRSGHLYLFERRRVDSVFKLSNVHGRFGITSIIVREDSNGYNLTTTGHDGRICELFLDVQDRKLELLVCNKTSIRWIDRTFCYSGKTFYLGFNDSHFLMVDGSNETYAHFDCGGGHRCWDFYYDEQLRTFSYVFIQRKRLKRVQFTPRRNVGSELCLPRFNWHTRACNVLDVVPRDDSYLLFSGGEDNILRINVMANGEMIENPWKHLFTHISSIKSLMVRRVPESDTLLMISAGGRAQICLTSVHMKSLRIKQEYQYMLLQTDAERSRWQSKRGLVHDPETKFMCAAPVGADRIVFGCSDGFIRIYQLSCSDGLWSLALVHEQFYGRCVLKVVSFEMFGSSIFVTMATDGYLCFWDASRPDEPYCQPRHHKSGVNAVDILINEPGKVLLATGGDDQAVVVSVFEVMKSGPTVHIRQVEQLCEKYLHTAQVTGIKLLADNRMISVGVDQRVYVTRFTDCYQKLEVESTANTCVADVKGLSVLLEDKTIIIYGCGIEILHLNL